MNDSLNWSWLPRWRLFSLSPDVNLGIEAIQVQVRSKRWTEASICQMTANRFRPRGPRRTSSSIFAKVSSLSSALEAPRVNTENPPKAKFEIFPAALCGEHQLSHLVYSAKGAFVIHRTWKIAQNGDQCFKSTKFIGVIERKWTFLRYFFIFQRTFVKIKHS